MVVTDSRLAAVRYFHEIKRYIREQHYVDMDILAAFSGTVLDGDDEYTEAGLNVWYQKVRQRKNFMIISTFR